MKRKIKIFKTVDEFIPGEACFIQPEIDYARRLASNQEPEDQRAFWDGVFEKKLVDRGYLIYHDFPVETPPVTAPAPQEPDLPQLPELDASGRPAFKGDFVEYVGAIADFLKENGRVRK